MYQRYSSDGLSSRVGATAVRHSGYKVKSKSEEAEFSRAIVLMVPINLSKSINTGTHHTSKQSN